jgi:hypothetical protein
VDNMVAHPSEEADARLAREEGIEPGQLVGGDGGRFGGGDARMNEEEDVTGAAPRKPSPGAGAPYGISNAKPDLCSLCQAEQPPALNSFKTCCQRGLRPWPWLTNQ